MFILSGSPFFKFAVSLSDFFVFSCVETIKNVFYPFIHKLLINCLRVKHKV